VRLNTLNLATLIAVTFAASAAAADCFRLNDVNAHSIGDNKTMYLAVGRHDIYRVSMKGACLGGATSSDPIITESFGSGPICRPIDLNLKIASGVGEIACIVDKFEKLTPEQIAAIPKKQRP